jgi:hypothetical protein
MKIKYALEMLAKQNPDDEIVIAYWTKDWFTDILAREITDDQWLDIADACDDTLEWNGIGDMMQSAAIELLDGDK